MPTVSSRWMLYRFSQKVVASTCRKVTGVYRVGAFTPGHQGEPDVDNSGHAGFKAMMRVNLSFLRCVHTVSCRFAMAEISAKALSKGKSCQNILSTLTMLNQLPVAVVRIELYHCIVRGRKNDVCFGKQAS